MKPEEIKKAVRGLKNIVEFWCYRPEEIETAKLAIAALEKQIPKKPKILAIGCDYPHGCSLCDCEVSKYGYNYCPNCGQRIDGSGEDEA